MPVHPNVSADGGSAGASAEPSVAYAPAPIDGSLAPFDLNHTATRRSHAFRRRRPSARRCGRTTRQPCFRASHRQLGDSRRWGTASAAHCGYTPGVLADQTSRMHIHRSRTHIHHRRTYVQMFTRRLRPLTPSRRACVWKILECMRRSTGAILSRPDFTFHLSAKTRVGHDTNSSIADFNSRVFAVSPASLARNSPRREFTSHRCGVRATLLEVSRRRPTFPSPSARSRRRLPAFTRRTTALSSRLPGADAPRTQLRSPPTLEPRSTPGRNPHLNTGRRDDRGSDERCSQWCRPMPTRRPRALAERSPRTAENRLIPEQTECYTK